MEERGEERGAGWGRGVGCGDRYGTRDLVEGKKKEVGYKPGAKNAAGRELALYRLELIIN